jgi:hypothetical protein
MGRHRWRAIVEDQGLPGDGADDRLGPGHDPGGRSIAEDKQTWLSRSYSTRPLVDLSSAA